MGTAGVKAGEKFYIRYVTRKRKPLGPLRNAGTWIHGTEVLHSEGPMSRIRADRRVVQIMFNVNTVPGETELTEE